ncbi:MAG TPA: hypothetical protein VNF47_15000 [Streptosporangiaceae bacterium]|nr:hypothetical protein [Streptosporangiaceae bacterium]
MTVTFLPRRRASAEAARSAATPALFEAGNGRRLLAPGVSLAACGDLTEARDDMVAFALVVASAGDAAMASAAVAVNAVTHRPRRIMPGLAAWTLCMTEAPYGSVLT